MRRREGIAGLVISGLTVTSLTLMAPSAHAASALAPLLGPGATAAGQDTNVVPDSYIVVLKDAPELKAAGVPAGKPKDVAQAAASRATESGGSIGQTYSHVFAGYSAKLSASELKAVRQDPAVDYVERNAKVTIEGAWEKNVDTWGLDRIDQRSLPVNTSYYYSARGQDVTAYVIDSGIYAPHPDFGGRVAPGVDEIGTTDGRDDCDGHGTHVAGTIGGQYYGVAKAVTLVPVRVLDCNGEGDGDAVLAGIDWVVGNHSGGPAVVNLSLGSGRSQVLNDAVQSMINDGMTVTVAAGNKSTDACTESPASAPDAITVAASTIKDRAASFSNYGSCVDLYAPGDNIVSDVPGKRDGQFWVQSYSGTSQASPHVAGVVALYLEKHPSASPAEVSAAVLGMASTNKISNAPSRTSKSLLFSLEPVPLPTGVTSGDRLYPGQTLLRGARLYSANNLYFLAHRSRDSWLCLYEASSGKVIWCSGHSAAWTRMNTNGALSSYDAYGRVAWSTRRTNIISTLFVNNKGYLMVKTRDGDVRWTTPH